MVSGIPVPPNFSAWHELAVRLLQRRMAPHFLRWQFAGQSLELDLFSPAEGAGSWESLPILRKAVVISPRLLPIARTVFYHRSSEKWALLYRVAFRLAFGSARLLEDPIDPDVRQLRDMFQSVKRDAHKMKAFVRFKKEGERYFAWYQPDHLTLPLVSDFFQDRFKSMHWFIATPDLCAEWDGQALAFSAGAPAAPGPVDGTDELWRTYYRSTFNPTRPRVRAMKKEMPVRFWRNLPESREIAPALRAARGRAEQMAQAQAMTAQPYVPPSATGLQDLAKALPGCKGCPLSNFSHNRVAGEGPRDAELVFVGEQPGDEEDLQGRPFVGPAGQLLMKAFGEAGIERSRVFLTNAVKDFRYQKVGKRRLHQRPRDGEVAACRPWLTAEMSLLRPRVLVCLGQTAAFSVLGRHFTLAEVRGKVFRSAFCERTVVIRHPSSILRTTDPRLREEAWGEFVKELGRAAQIGASTVR